MSKIIFIKTNNNDINYLEQKEGQLLYCTDTNKVYYDNKELIRLNISMNSLIIDTDDKRISMINPLINKIYIVPETEKVYSHDGFRWSQIENTTQLEQMIGSNQIGRAHV